MKNSKSKVCEKCNTSFSCFNEACWCSELPAIMPLDENRDCLCSSCLKEEVIDKIQDYLKNLSPAIIDSIKALGTPNKLIQGIDYTINEKGLFVFSSWYHLRKGNCCNNNCINCPY